MKMTNDDCVRLWENLKNIGRGETNISKPAAHWAENKGRVAGRNSSITNLYRIENIIPVPKSFSSTN